MFYYKTVFRKMQYFWRKLRKTHLWVDTTVLRGGRRLVTEINITFFVGVEVLNIIHLTIFSRKRKFSEINVKKNFFRGA